MTVNYRVYQMARNKANEAMRKANAKYGFDRAVELEIYTIEHSEIVTTTVRVHEYGLNTFRIDDLAILMGIAKEMATNFTYNGYTVTYNE